MPEIHVICEICGTSSASTVVGGVYDNTHGVYIVCEECKKAVKDERKEVRDGTNLS